jgi:hypothetical protein
MTVLGDCWYPAADNPALSKDNPFLSANLTRSVAVDGRRMKAAKDYQFTDRIIAHI